jgi:hypothetical protein
MILKVLTIVWVIISKNQNKKLMMNVLEQKTKLIEQH